MFIRPAISNLTKEDVLGWIRKATFLKIDYNSDCIKQVFSMPADNPFREDYDDGGGPYRLEKISIDYKYDNNRVVFYLSVGTDMRDVSGCRTSEFMDECSVILFQKSARLDLGAVEEYLRKNLRDKLKQRIREHIKWLGLSRADAELAFDEIRLLTEWP